VRACVYKTQRDTGFQTGKRRWAIRTRHDLANGLIGNFLSSAITTCQRALQFRCLDAGVIPVLGHRIVIYRCPAVKGEIYKPKSIVINYLSLRLQSVRSWMTSGFAVVSVWGACAFVRPFRHCAHFRCCLEKNSWWSLATENTNNCFKRFYFGNVSL